MTTSRTSDSYANCGLRWLAGWLSVSVCMMCRSSLEFWQAFASAAGIPLRSLSLSAGGVIGLHLHTNKQTKPCAELQGLVIALLNGSALPLLVRPVSACCLWRDLLRRTLSASAVLRRQLRLPSLRSDPRANARRSALLPFAALLPR